MLQKTLNHRHLSAVAAKVALQINCKLGGCPWTVTIPVKKMIVIGFDVCHDAQDKTKSVGQYSG